MKRKLVKKNKKHLSKMFRKYGDLCHVFRSFPYDENILLYMHRYELIDDFKNAVRDDEWIWIPVVVNSKSKRSRIKNYPFGDAVEFSIEEFNARYGTDLKFEDIPKG